MDYYVDTAEDYIIDDEAEEIEDAMDDLVKYDYNDIDNIADISDDYNEYEDENIDYEDDEDSYYEDDSEFIDYEISDEY